MQNTTKHNYNKNIVLVKSFRFPSLHSYDKISKSSLKIKSFHSFRVQEFFLSQKSFTTRILINLAPSLTAETFALTNPCENYMNLPMWKLQPCNIMQQLAWTYLTCINFRADYISQFLQILAFCVKYNPRETLPKIHTRYQEKYLKNGNGREKVDNNNSGFWCVFLFKW